MLLAAIYSRVSKDGAGAGLEVERQRADCQELADHLGWTVVDHFSDDDISAYSWHERPGYDAMCAALESGGAGAVISWHADRLHRRPIERESFIDLCDRKDTNVRTVQAGTVDLSTAGGKEVARMLGVAARHEVEHGIERRRAAKEQATLDGKVRGCRRAFGYDTNGIDLRPDEVAAIRKSVDDLIAGISLSQIARDWNAAGLRTSFSGKTFTSREVRKILLRPHNAGIVMLGGRPIAQGTWERIIDADKFGAVTAVLGDPSRKVSASFECKYQGSGVYVCGRCGARMLAAAHNRTELQGWRGTYVCSVSKHLGRDIEHLDAYVNDFVVGVASRPDAGIRLSGDPGTDVAALHGQRDGLHARLEEPSALVGTASINGPPSNRENADIRAQLDGINTQLATAHAASVVANLILAGHDALAIWHATAQDVRGNVIDSLMTVTVLPAPRGRRPGGGYFDPASVRVDWKVAQTPLVEGSTERV